MLHVFPLSALASIDCDGSPQCISLRIEQCLFGGLSSSCIYWPRHANWRHQQFGVHFLSLFEKIDVTCNATLTYAYQWELQLSSNLPQNLAFSPLYCYIFDLKLVFEVKDVFPLWKEFSDWKDLTVFFLPKVFCVPGRKFVDLDASWTLWTFFPSAIFNASSPCRTTEI